MKKNNYEKMKELATIINENIDPSLGFCLLVYPFKQKGIIHYISNSEREDVITLLDDFLEKMKKVK